MFTWLNKQGVRNENGYAVQCTSRFSFEYREGDRKLSIYFEPGIINGKHAVLVYQSSIYEWRDGRSISDEKRKKIIKNFCDAMDFMDIAVKIVKDD